MNIEKALNYLRDKSKEYAVARGNMEYLKEYRKSKKALLMVEAEKQGITASNKQETWAYAHKDYIELLEGLHVAVETEAELRHMVKAATLKIEVWRTQESSKRTEMNAYNSRGSN